jgi:RNA polymerase-binding transcription factor
MATKRSRSEDRRQRKVRERIERDRQTAIEQLRALGISPSRDGHGEADADHPRDEGDQAQASERQDLGVMTRERLAERIKRLSAALDRLQDGTYGQCEICGNAIEPPRLDALPDVTTCLACQRERERAA